MALLSISRPRARLWKSFTSPGSFGGTCWGWRPYAGPLRRRTTTVILKGGFLFTRLGESWRSWKLLWGVDYVGRRNEVEKRRKERKKGSQCRYQSLRRRSSRNCDNGAVLGSVTRDQKFPTFFSDFTPPSAGESAPPWPTAFPSSFPTRHDARRDTHTSSPYRTPIFPARYLPINSFPSLAVPGNPPPST